MKCTLAVLFLAILTTTPALAEDWSSKLSPRMKQAFRPMLSPDWSPRKEVELTPQERKELEKAMPHLRDFARQIFREMAPKPPLSPP